jgi:hypothetical protein
MMGAGEADDAVAEVLPLDEHEEREDEDDAGDEQGVQGICGEGGEEFEAGGGRLGEGDADGFFLGYGGVGVVGGGGGSGA